MRLGVWWLASVLVLGAGARSSDQLVNVGKLEPSIRMEMRYATPDNFLKKSVYDRPICLLRPDPARALVRVQKALKELHLGLKVWDAYRPHSVQEKMWQLVPDERFVANPRKGS